ncbi:ATP-binding protein [Candidatus Omnitrophota bacterium]
MKQKARLKQNKTIAKADYRDLTYKYKLLSDLMDCIPDVIYFKDKEGRLIMVNQAHAKGLGLKPEQVAGKTDFDFFPKKRAELMTKDDMYVLKTGKAIIDKVERATRPDGIDNYVSTTKIPRQDKKGKIVGLIGITRDITSRIQLESLMEEKDRIQKKLKALEELNNMKSEFVSVVSHELRTPLAIIKEAVMLVFGEVAGPANDKQKELLAKARDNVNRLNNIIRELLDISRIEKGQLKLHYSLANLNNLLLDSSDFFKKLAKEKGIRLKYSLPKDEVNIFVDVGRVSQAVSNLISNAIKFTEQNGEIKIEVEILETKIRIGVIDTGVGVAEEDLDRLFDKFVQVSKVPGAERKGVGLGLPITKDLVEKHGGEIWVESKLGTGSRFYFTLPLFYTTKILNKNIRETIDSLLHKDTGVYLINLLIVNFEEFKKKTGVNPRKLFRDLKLIIDSTFNGYREAGRKKARIALQDYGSGEWSILLPETSEDEVAKICDLIKDEMNNYFAKNKIKDVFINLGIMYYSHGEKDSRSKQFPANIHIKNMYIGSEIRRFKRIGYKTDIEIIASEDKTEFSQAVDISQGGICFVSKGRLETDAPVRIRLKLPKDKKAIDIKACVAWRKSIKEETVGLNKSVDRYKIGLQFIDLRDREIKRLSRLIKSLSS